MPLFSAAPHGPFTRRLARFGTKLRSSSLTVLFVLSQLAGRADV
jgi:hypothetical protein